MTSPRWLLILIILFPGLSACAKDVHQVWQSEARAPEASGLAPKILAPVDSDASQPAPSTSQTPIPTVTAAPLASPTSQPEDTLYAPVSPSPASTATPTSPVCLQQGSRIVHGSLETKLLRYPLVYRVYLPPCYREFTAERYPVLYLIHGQGFTDEQWDRIGADETADRLIASGEIPPLIIVMPYERYGGEPTENGFAQAFIKELIPHIDETYRTLPTPQRRAVGGLSRGGGWAIHFGLAYWKLFRAIGAHSPAVFHTDAQSMRTYLDTIPASALPRIYIDIGDRDRPEILRSAAWFEELLDEKDIPHEWHLFSGYHNEAYWSEHMPLYLEWYTQGW